MYTANPLEQEWADCSIKSWSINIFGFFEPQGLCLDVLTLPCTKEAARDSKCSHGCGRAPIELV